MLISETVWIQKLARMNRDLKAYNFALLIERYEAYLAVNEGEPIKPMNGDYVRFADGVERRVSHRWPKDIQTSDGGSWHLGTGYVSFSGGLYRSVPTKTLKLTDEMKEGRYWFFDENHHTADSSVAVTIPVRAWVCSENAPKV